MIFFFFIQKFFIKFLLIAIQGRCAPNHQGPLCYNCVKGYARISSKETCRNCENNVWAYFKMSLSLLIILIYISLQIRYTVDIKSKYYIGIMMKQLITHFQQITIISLLNLGWTVDFKSLFNIQNYFSFISEEFFSLDCLFENFQYNTLMKKVLVSNLLPLFIMIIFFCLLFIQQVFEYLRSRNFDLMIIIVDFKICSVMTVYILFPEIIRKCFSLMNCIKIENFQNKGVLLHSPDVYCWSEYHLFHFLTISLPGIIIWGLLYPLLLFILMYRSRSNIKIIIRTLAAPHNKIESKVNNTEGINKINIQKPNPTKKNSRFNSILKLQIPVHKTGVFLKFIYQGYIDEYYFWELVIFAKKIILLFVQSFSELFPDESKSIMLLVIIILFLLAQIRYQPYQQKELNHIEMCSLFITFLSANIGVLLFSEDMKKASAFLMYLMIIINIGFILYWLLIFFRLKKKFSTYRTPREDAQKKL